MKNGDAILARFATCSLSIQAHYLVHKETKADSLITLVKDLSKEILIDEKAKGKAEKIIMASTLNDLKNNLVIEGKNDSHQFMIIPMDNDFFSYRIFYKWIPPEV